MPDERERILFLLDEVWRQRQAGLAALRLQISKTFPQIHDSSSFAQALEDFRNHPRVWRRGIVGSPPFVVWLKKAIRVAREAHARESGETLGDLVHVLDDFGPMLERCDLAQKDPTVLRLACGAEVRRTNVDQLIREAAPPTYDFESSERLMDGTESGYSISFFTRVAEISLERIRAMWPELYELFPQLVRTIIHIPTADFRSASASRYTSVVFLSAGDRSLLEVEESLVHEYGHQVLYFVMEIDPLLRHDVDRLFILPWSGSERDFYGYFHAFYIYILLARYFERVSRSQREDKEQARSLLAHTIKGAVQALPDFADLSYYTERGSQLMGMLRAEVKDLVNAHQPLLSREAAAT